MNPFRYKSQCEVCGGEGVTTSAGNRSQWTKGSFMSHMDPRECAAVLAAKKREEEKATR